VLTDTDLAALESILGKENLSTRSPDLEAHSADESWVEPRPPDVVVWPKGVQEVSSVLQLANQRGIPVVPWSGGSSLEGNPVPVHGGIVLAMYRLDRIIEIREDDLQVTVQPGVVYDALNAQLRRLGMFFPPAPGSSDVATIGGMVANNASGMRAVKYGVTRDYVLGLEVVLPDGQMVSVGGKAKKSTSGYDLTSLFVGSEGTLGVVTEITLRLVGLPEKVAAAVAVFDRLGDATTAVYECVRYGLGLSATEILDSATVEAINQQQGLDLKVAPTLFLEFHGTQAAVEEQVQYVRELCEENGCLDFQSALTAEAYERLWSGRREAHDSIKLSHPGCTMVAGDVCVPISRFGEMVEFAHGVSKRLDLLVYVFGHAGDGNLHTEIIAQREDGNEFSRALSATDEIVNHALDLGGTVAGEHGIGFAKRHFMAREHGPSLRLMQAIKELLDPNGIMNPGKIFPSRR